MKFIQALDREGVSKIKNNGKYSKEENEYLLLYHIHKLKCTFGDSFTTNEIMITYH